MRKLVIISITLSILCLETVHAQKPRNVRPTKRNKSITPKFNRSASNYNQKINSRNGSKNQVFSSKFRQQFNKKSRLPKVNRQNTAGRGSTGRTITRNQIERNAMRRFRKNPASNVSSILKNRDPRWKGWSKMRYKDKNGTLIHFNRKLGRDGKFRYDDLKFKDKSYASITSLKTRQKIKRITNQFNRYVKRTRYRNSVFNQFYQASK